MVLASATAGLLDPAPERSWPFALGLVRTALVMPAAQRRRERRYTAQRTWLPCESQCTRDGPGILKTVAVDEPEKTETQAAAALRDQGARFAFVYGSRVEDGGNPGSDLDIAAWWGATPPASWEVNLPDGVDLLVLDEAPLELAGRVALRGRLLFDDDPPARVRWQAQTRLVYLDEQDRQSDLDRVFLGGRAGGR